MILIVTLSFLLSSVGAYILPSTSIISNSMRLQSAVESMPDLDLDGIAGRMKLIKFGQGPKRTFGLESRDRNTFIKTKEIEVSRDGGIGLQLIEVENNAIDNSGLVLVEGIVSGSNADKTGEFLVGDALMSVITPDGKNIPLLGCNYDKVMDTLGNLQEYNTIKFTVQRIQKRGEVTLEVVGPQGEAVGEYTILSGYSTNLRNVLDAANLRIYDQRTSRFDSPYETGNCGGEGTCGTCMVAVLEGQELTNGRVAVEDGALKKQVCPPNYRWSCRMQVGSRPETNGKLKVKLRPQTAAWDAQEKS